MGGIEVGIASVVVIVFLIYTGLYIPVALGLVSFLGVWLIRGNVDIAVALLSESIADTVSELVFASVPLFALMGLIVSKAGLGKDVYEFANFIFYRIRGGLGIAPWRRMRSSRRSPVRPSPRLPCSPGSRSRRCAVSAISRDSPSAWSRARPCWAC